MADTPFYRWFEAAEFEIYFAAEQIPVLTKPEAESAGNQKHVWVRNFLPGSSAEGVLDWLPSYFKGEPPDKDSLWSALVTYKEESGLKYVDLTQLRDQALFDAETIPNSNKRQSRSRIVQLTEELLATRDVLA
jgi:hypothetical protein